VKAFHRIVMSTALLISALIGTAEPAQPVPQWQPDPPKYEFDLTKNLDVQMDDGVHLRVDVYYPVDPTTKRRASGKFPVLLEQTPYGKDRIARGSENTAKYFVSRGYIFAVADLRGFGNSWGQASWFGARVGQDGAKLVQWAAHLDNSSGKVGLTGCSYSGVAQYFTANSLSANPPVKAMAPFCTDSNFYRDLTAFGGIPTQFIAAVRALTPPGVDDDPTTDPFMQTMISQATGDNAYYNDYWESLNVTRFMPKIVSLGIPVLSETGWYDLFPGANIDATLAAQNTVGHRALDQPLRSASLASGRYQAIVGPWIHGEHTGDTLQPILLEWFDTWLKGKTTGFTDATKPLHLYLIGANRWIDSATYPLTDRAVTFHLSPGALNVKESASTCMRDGKSARGCSAPLIWAPEFEGTSVLTFDSPPLEAPLVIGGPGSVTIYLKSSRPEIELTATLFEVSADGTAVKITDGAQLGSQREPDPATSWYSGDGKLIRPNHFFTKEKSSAVPIGESVRLDIELVPTVIRIAAGQRLRLKLLSEPSATTFRQYWKAVQMPNPLAPTPQELGNLVGGEYAILFGSEGASVMNLSTASDADLTDSTTNWGPKD
jgi:predicted acyl esterase